MESTDSLITSAHLKPHCPRDDHVMNYESGGIHWKNETGEAKTHPSYHCCYLGCSVRYDAANGYYTVVTEPDLPYFVDEPGVNLARCPRHVSWLYRTRDAEGHFLLKCAIEGCDYERPDLPGIWLRE